MIYVHVFALQLPLSQLADVAECVSQIHNDGKYKTTLNLSVGLPPYFMF